MTDYVFIWPFTLGADTLSQESFKRGEKKIHSTNKTKNQDVIMIYLKIQMSMIHVAIFEWLK